MIEQNLGIELDYIVIGLTGLVIILIIFMLISVVQNRKLKKKYNAFMIGKNGESLEETIIKRLDQVEELVASDEKNKADIENLFGSMNATFQKIGMVKYDAFHEMGGKLSFSIALLNRTNDGFILNAMHSREGCYTYIKEIIKGNSILVLGSEEKEALEIAMGIRKPRIEED